MNPQNAIHDEIFMTPSQSHVTGEFKPVTDHDTSSHCSGHCQSGTCVAS